MIFIRRIYYRYILLKKYRQEHYKQDLARYKKQFKFHTPPPAHIRKAIKDLKVMTKEFWRV